MPRDDRAALAANWWTILAVDAVIGWAALILGLVLVSRGSALLGSLLFLAGLAYVALNLRRLRRWKRVRAEHGLG